MADKNPFKTTSEDFKKLVPDFEQSLDKEDFMRVVTAARRELDRLNAMKDDDGEKKASPTQLARKELVKKYEEDAEEFVFENVDNIFDWVSRSVPRASAVAEVLRELADHFDFLGNLHVQDLRNEKFVGSSETDDDAVAQREIVSRLIDNASILQTFTTMAGDDVSDVEIPTLRGNKVGTQNSGVRRSSAYPVIEANMMFTVDGKKLPINTSLSHAVINHLFTRLGKHSYGMDIEHNVIGALKKENKNWSSPGEETTIFFEAGDEIVEFKVNNVRKNDPENTPADDSEEE